MEETDYEKMRERNDYDKNYYISRDGEKITYDPKTIQPPVVYGESPYAESDLEELEEIDDDGLIIHESHGEYELYGGDAENHSETYVGETHQPVIVDEPSFAAFDVAALNGYGRDLQTTALYQDELAPENGKFHIRYYGVVEHSQFAPPDPDCTDGSSSGLVSLSVRGLGDSHLHTDVHTFNPMSLLAQGSCPRGARVRVDIQDFENVLMDYIYNYPRQLKPDDLGALDQTFVELGQWDGNKKMTLEDFLETISRNFPTDLGDLRATLEAYAKDREWIEAVPTQLGVSLDESDAVCLPYSHLPKPYVQGVFEHNPATRIATLAFRYVDYIIVPPKDERRIFQMSSPQLFRAGTVPAEIAPKQATRLPVYADVTVRKGCSEIQEEDRDVLDLVLRPDGSVFVDGTFWLRHHKVGEPTVEENDRWRIEIDSRGGAILL